MAAATMLNQIKMSLHKAKREYAGRSFGEAAAILSWVATIAQARNADGNREWAELREQANWLLRQLSLGLDHFGLPYDYVPLVTVEVFSDEVQKLLNLGTSIEDSYTAYWKEGAERDIRRQAIEQSLHSAGDAVTLSRQALVNLGERKEEAQAAYRLLFQDSQEKGNQLVSADDKFKAAVQARASCEFFSVVQCVSTVVAVGSAAYGDVSGIIGILTNGATAARRAPNMPKDQRIIESMKEIGSNLQDLKSQYSKIKPFLSDEPNKYKLLTTRESWEARFKEYEDLPEAREYRDLMRDYWGICDAMNQKLVEYSALVVKEGELARSIALLESERGKLSTSFSLEADPAADAYVVFLEHINSAVKEQILSALYWESRAYSYWALEAAPLVSDDQSIAALKKHQADLVSRTLEARNHRNGAPQKFKNLAWHLDVAKNPSFSTFRKTGRLVFAIPLDDALFGDMREVVLTDIGITIPRVKTRSGDLEIRLVHHGKVKVRDRAGKVHNFAHRPRPMLFLYKIHNWSPHTDGIGSGDGYADLSPFSLWTLEVSTVTNPGLQLQKIKTIQFAFSGKYVAPI